MKRDNVRQFKLVSGEEIICEVIDWEAEETEELVVRNMYKILSVESPDDSTRYYTFRQYMCLQGEESMFQTLNPYHIIATAIPAPAIIDQLETNVNLNKMSYEEITRELNKKLDGIRKKYNLVDDEDSDGEDPESKIIQFTPKDKLH